MLHETQRKSGTSGANGRLRSQSGHRGDKLNRCSSNRMAAGNYMGNLVVARRTGAPECTGHLSFDSSATTDDRNRFRATIMTGKTAGKQVFVHYDTATCKIISFGLIENG